MLSSATSFGACCSQRFDTYSPRACPQRGSARHKIAMHVNSTVHEPNEPWQWKLGDFKRLHPPRPTPQHMCV